LCLAFFQKINKDKNKKDSDIGVYHQYHQVAKNNGASWLLLGTLGLATKTTQARNK
jgi:hypothetical protein